MAFQNTATDYLAIGYEGDRVGAIFYPDKPARVVDTNGVKVGKFVWLVKDTINGAVTAQGTNTTLFGVVHRSQTTVNVTQGLTTNANLIIPQGQEAQIIERGEVLVKITSIAGTNPVAQSSAVYVDTNGNIVADGGGTLTSYIKTNFVFTGVSTDLTVGSLVKISNVSNVV